MTPPLPFSETHPLQSPARAPVFNASTTTNRVISDNFHQRYGEEFYEAIFFDRADGHKPGWMKNNLHYGPTYVLTVNVAFGKDGLMKELHCPGGVPSGLPSDISEHHAAFLVLLNEDFEARRKRDIELRAHLLQLAKQGAAHKVPVISICVLPDQGASEHASMDATAMQLAQAFEDFIDTHKLGCDVDIAVYREAGADRQYNRTGHLSDFRQRQGERLCLFHVDGPGTGTETRRIAKALTQMCVQLRSLPTVILYGARSIRAAGANELHGYLTGAGLKKPGGILFYAYAPTSATYHLDEKRGKVQDSWPAVAPAVGSTSWIIPTTLSLEHTKNDPTKHEQLWSRLCELARKPNYFLVGLPLLRRLDAATGTDKLKALLKPHHANPDDILKRYKIVLTAFSSVSGVARKWPAILLDAILQHHGSLPRQQLDPKGIHLFHVILLPAEFNELEKATAFTNGNHGILVHDGTPLGPLLDAPAVVACCYGAGFRATAEVARAGKIAIPWCYSGDSDGVVNSTMVTAYTDDPRGDTHDPRWVKIEGGHAANADDVQLALKYLVAELMTPQSGYQKNAASLRSKLLRGHPVPEPAHEATRPYGAIAAHAHDVPHEQPPAPAISHKAVSSGPVHKLPLQEPATGQPSSAPRLPSNTRDFLEHDAPSSSTPSQLDYGTAEDRAVRQRLVHSIFGRLGWPGGKPTSHA